MSKTWKKIDFGPGPGLQAMNAKLTQAMKSRTRAYLLWPLFPLGLHRFYLKEPRGGSVYLLLSLLAGTLSVVLSTAGALAPLLVSVLFALFDLLWIDGAVVRYNKHQRMAHYLKPGSQPPRDYKGRYTDESELSDYLAQKGGERAGHQPVDMNALQNEEQTQSKRPSFNEQEALLKEMFKHKQEDKKD